MFGLEPQPKLSKKEYSKIDLKKINWVLQDGIAMPFLSYYPEICVTTDLQKYGWPFNLVIAIYFNKGQMSWNFDRAQMEDYAEKIINMYLKGKKEIHRIHKIWLKFQKKYNKTYQYALDRVLPNLSKLDDHKLWQEFANFHTDYINEYTPALCTEFFSAYGDKLLEEISRKSSQYISQAITLSTPNKFGFLQSEKIDALKIASDAKINLKEIQTHQQKYFWIHNNYRDTQPLDVGYFRKEIEKLKIDNPQRELIKIKGDLKLLKQKQSKIIQEKIFDQKTQLALELVSFCTHWQDQRKMCNLKANFVLNEFLKEFSRRLKIDLNDFHYTTPYELKEAFFDGLEISKLIKPRKGFFCRVTVPNKELFLVGKDAQKVLQIFSEMKNPSKEIKEIKGVPTSLGYVKGYVKIVLDVKEARDFQSGDILVTGMTRPEFVPLMKKASAIITDEGGLTCHAAIISRELGIPCIIGTKIATKVLKDGDLVKVDAGRGIIKKL